MPYVLFTLLDVLRAFPGEVWRCLVCFMQSYKPTISMLLMLITSLRTHLSRRKQLAQVCCAGVLLITSHSQGSTQAQGSHTVADVQVPDVSVVLHTSDYPCLKANHSVADIEFRQPDTVLPDEHWNGEFVQVRTASITDRLCMQCQANAVAYAVCLCWRHGQVAIACAGRPIPVMGYNRKEGFLDLMFPDFTYYGHEYSQIVGAQQTALPCTVVVR